MPVENHTLCLKIAACRWLPSGSSFCQGASLAVSWGLVVLSHDPGRPCRRSLCCRSCGIIGCLSEHIFATPYSRSAVRNGDDDFFRCHIRIRGALALECSLVPDKRCASRDTNCQAFKQRHCRSIALPSWQKRASFAKPELMLGLVHEAARCGLVPTFRQGNTPTRTHACISLGHSSKLAPL